MLPRLLVTLAGALGCLWFYEAWTAAAASAALMGSPGRLNMSSASQNQR